MALFHVAAVEDRESILRHGLDFRKAEVVSLGQEEAAGNYLWDSLADANSFACYQIDMDGIETDIWEVEREGLALLPDPYYEMLVSVEEMESLSGSAWRSLDVIPVSALRLVHCGEI
jgi:hypothetical protein